MALALPTGMQGRALALGLTVLAAAAAWTGIASPVGEWHQDRAELLRRQQALARRMAALVETLPALRRQAEDAAPGNAVDGQAGPALLSGDTYALAAASLQQQIEELAAREGVRIGSQEIMPGQQEGDLGTVTVRLMTTAPFRSFVALLLALTRSDTLMIADDVQMRVLAGAARALDGPIEASLTVTSYRVAKADAR